MSGSARTVTTASRNDVCEGGLDGQANDCDRFEAAKSRENMGFASPATGALVLANTLLGGTGMLGIPHALSVAGYALGAGLIVLFGCASAFGSHLLHCSARKIAVAPCSFYTVAGAVAPRWTWLIDGAVAVKCFGVGTSYLMIVGDLAPQAAGFFGVALDRWVWVTMGFVIAGSLACLKNLSALRYTAMVAILICIWTVILLGLNFASPSDTFAPCAQQAHAKLPCQGAAFKPIGAAGFKALCKAFPVFIFGFTCQQNVFTVCNEVRQATQKRLDLVLLAAYSLVAAAFFLAAFFGYATYGDQVNPDVLKGYPASTPVELTRALYSLLVIFSYPMQAHPSRTSALALWNLVAGPPGAPSGAGRLLDVDAAQVERAATQRFAIITAGYLLLSYAVAISLEDLGVILGIVGATGSTMVSYILPGLLYTRAFPNPHFKRNLAIGQLALGCVIMPTCLVAIFL